MRGCFIFILITAAIIAIYNKADSFSNNVETPAKLVYINQDINKHICVLNSNEDIFGRMTNMSARDCAKFYYANNSKYSFVDSIYTKQVIPIIFDGNSFDIVETYKVLKGTSSMQNINDYVDNGKQKILDAIKNEIAHNANQEYYMFVDHFEPLLLTEIDSMIEADAKTMLEDIDDDDKIENVLKDYFDNNKYNDVIKKYVNTYLNVLYDQKNQDYYDIVGTMCSFRDSIEYPSYKQLNLSCTQEMTEFYNLHAVYRDSIYWDEKKDMLIDAVVELASEIPYVGGAISAGSLAYDAYSIYDELTKEEDLGLNPTEKFLIMLEGGLTEQIQQHITEEIRESIKMYLMYYNDIEYIMIKNKIRL